MASSFFGKSITATQVSRFLVPLGVVTVLTCILAVAVYALAFYPAQNRLNTVTAAYEVEHQTQERKQKALKTQKTLVKVWNQLPARRDFTALGVAIVTLAKSHNVRIPGMGYDIQPSKNKKALKGVIAFEAAGRYEAIRKFIFKMESTWPHLFIEKLTAQRTKKQNEVAFKIKAATFLKIEDDKPRTTKKRS